MKAFLRLYLPFAVLIAVITALVGWSLTRSEMARLESIETGQIKLGSEIISEFLHTHTEQITGMMREPEISGAFRLPLDAAKPAVQEIFVTLLYRNTPYQQARWLNREGYELVRVMQGREVPQVLPGDKLANKANTEWFRSAIAQPAGETYVAALDPALDDQNKPIPAQPVLRLVMRLPSEPSDQGLLVVNIAAQELFRHLRDLMAPLDKTSLLLNARGEWLLAPGPQSAFGPPANSFAARHPAEWARISAQPAGQMRTPSGIWTWNTIDPAAVVGGKVASAEAWKLVTLVPAAAIAALIWKIWWPLLAVAGTTLSFLVFGTFQYRKLWLKREVAGSEQALIAEKASVEQRLRLATEGADVGVWFWEIAKNTMEWSEQCKKHLALPPGREPNFDDFYAVMHPDDRERIRRKIEEAVENRQDYYAEYRIMNPDRSVRWVAAPGRVYVKPDGTLEGMSGLTIDITKLKETEASLRELTANLEKKVEERTQALADSQRSFRLLAENASDVVLETDTAGLVTYVSPSSSTSLGRKPEQITGLPFRNLVHPDEWDAIESLEAQIRKGTPANEEVRLRIGEDGYQWFSLSMKPLLAASGAVEGCIGGLRDIQREVQVREAVKAERVRLKATLDSLLEPLALVQPVRGKDGHVTDFIYADANPAACGWMQTDREHLLGGRMLELFPGVETAGLMNTFRETAETGRPTVIDNFPFPLGEATRWLDIRAVKVDDRVSFAWRDVTEQHRHQEIIANERKHLADVIEGSDTGTWEWYVQTGAVIFNEVWAKLLGYRLAELQPADITTWEKFTHPDDLARAKTVLGQCFKHELEIYECETRMRRRNGTWIWILTRGRVVEWTADGKPLRMLGTHRDITASVELRQRLEREATTDALTGLCNRREFETLAHRELSRANRQGAPLSLLMMDIDKFKSINDTHGHEAGDAVLKTLATACAPHLREVDILARIGGEEFTVLMPDTPLEGATHVAGRIREALAHESVPAGDGRSISFTVSIGVAQHDGNSEELPTLVKRADEALYQAKNTGRNRVVVAPAGEASPGSQSR